MITVTAEEKKDNQKGPWRALTYTNDKGESGKTTNIFGKIVTEQYKGLGKYDVKWIQKGNYWNVDSMELVAATAPSNGHGPIAGPVAGVQYTGTGQVKSVIAAAAMRTAGEVVAAMLNAKMLERKEAETYVQGYFETFANEQLKWVKADQAKTDSSKPKPHPEGA